MRYLNFIAIVYLKKTIISYLWPIVLRVSSFYDLLDCILSGIRVIPPNVQWLCEIDELLSIYTNKKIKYIRFKLYYLQKFESEFKKSLKLFEQHVSICMYNNGKSVTTKRKSSSLNAYNRTYRFMNINYIYSIRYIN